jgi:hypothetical protein
LDKFEHLYFPTTRFFKPWAISNAVLSRKIFGLVGTETWPARNIFPQRRDFAQPTMEPAGQPEIVTIA